MKYLPTIFGMVFGLLLGLSFIINPFGERDQKTKSLPNGLYARVYTPKGDFIFRLEYKKAPMTVANFVGLAEGSIKNSFRKEGQPFFDSLTFHRVVPDFVIQGGDPNGNGSGNPGYRFPQETRFDLTHHVAGTVAMANSGPNTNGSQWYVTMGPTPNLDGGYNVFGYVVKGMEVVQNISIGDRMNKVEILRFGFGPYFFDAPGTFYRIGKLDKSTVKAPGE